MLRTSGAVIIMVGIMEAVNFYPETCVIRRSTGQVDPDTRKEVFEPVYSGSCGLQRGGNGNTFLQGGQFLDAPLIILPDASLTVLTNDDVEVTDLNGRVMRFTAEQAEPIHDADIGGVTVWLKTGDTPRENG